MLVAYGVGDKIDGAYKGTMNNDWVPLIYPESANHYVYDYNNSAELFLSRGVDLVLAPEKYMADDLNAHGVPALCVSLYGNPTFDNYVNFLSQLVTQVWDGDEIKSKSTAWENKVSTAINDVKSELAKHEITKRKFSMFVATKIKVSDTPIQKALLQSMLIDKWVLILLAIH